MKKKILLMIFAFVIGLFGIKNVAAKLVCEYKQQGIGESLLESVLIIYDTPRSFPRVIKNGREDPDYAAYLNYSGGCEDIVYYSYASDRFYLDDPNMDRASLKLIKEVRNKVSCGNGEGKITDIPLKIPELTSMMFTIVQVAVPIILVIMGSIDLFKGITSGKEDEMKKGRQMFIKRLVVGAIIFLVVIIVKLIISIVADTGVANMVDCIDCFISNDCGEW